MPGRPKTRKAAGGSLPQGRNPVWTALVVSALALVAGHRSTLSGQAMQVHHLSCGTMCPLGGRLMYGPRRDPSLRRLVCHCLLIETDRHGLVLVDTGLGLQDVRQPRPRLGWFFLMLNRLQLREEETAVRQLERLGFRAGDVRHIVLTHLDFDHAGGIEDFPGATVHLLDAELQAAHDRRRGFIARQRYRPQQWDERLIWRDYAPGGDRWLGFESVRDLKDLPPELLMVPLVGHTWGHCGVAVQLSDHWLLHAGDAYFYADELSPDAPACPPGLRVYQWMMEVHRGARLSNQHRLRELARQRAGEVEIFCSHDSVEFTRLRNRTWYEAEVGPAEPLSPEPAAAPRPAYAPRGAEGTRPTAGRAG